MSQWRYFFGEIMITILEETTKNPISKIGFMAGVCWNSPTDDAEKNYKRGMDCILSEHGRTLEFPDVELVIDGYSARCIREWYTHIAGGPTRLQSSTRYVKWTDGFANNFVVPPTVQKTFDSAEAKKAYDEYCAAFQKLMDTFDSFDVPKEDAAMFYPLGMKTKIVDKRNLRNLIEMSHQRLCSRAYWEYRRLMKDICDALSSYSDEWKWIVENLMKAKCEVTGFCKEKKSCGRRPKNQD